MGAYIQPRRQRTGFASGRYAIAICDGCGFKRPYLELQPSPVTGLRYCDECGVDAADRLLPAILSGRIALRYPSPDVVLDVPGGGGGGGDSGGAVFLFEDGGAMSYEDGGAILYEGA